MAQQKQLIPGNTELYTAGECDNKFITLSGENTVTNFKLIGNTNIQGDISANTVLVLNNLICNSSDVSFNGDAKFITGLNSNDNNNMSYLQLYAGNSSAAVSADKGSFILSPAAKTGVTRKQLKGYPNGELKWGNNHLVQSVNGNKADADGNVSINSVSSATIAEKDSSGNVIATTYVNLANNQTITGTKTFNMSPVIPNPPDSSNTNIAASTKWVNDRIYNSFKKGGTWKKLVNVESFNWWQTYPNGIPLVQSCLDFDYLVVCLDINGDPLEADAFCLYWFPNFILRCSAAAPADTDMSGKYRILTAITYNNFKVQFAISNDGMTIKKPGSGGDASYENSICTGIYGVNVY